LFGNVLVLVGFQALKIPVLKPAQDPIKGSFFML
jgi:hypothetical protein